METHRFIFVEHLFSSEVEDLGPVKGEGALAGVVLANKGADSKSAFRRKHWVQRNPLGFP